MACPVAIFGTLLNTSRQAQRRALRRRPRPPDLRKRDAIPSGPRFPLRTPLPPQDLVSTSDEVGRHFRNSTTQRRRRYGQPATWRAPWRWSAHDEEASWRGR